MNNENISESSVSAGSNFDAQQSSDQNRVKEVARNEPCPCKSGKKYKRCHGVDAKGVVGTPKIDTSGSNEFETAMGNLDPSKLDQDWMQKFSLAMSRLPKGQLQRMQSLMKQAMMGKDVNKEMEEFQRTLPPSFQEMMAQAPKDLEQNKGEAAVTGKPSRGFFKRLFNR